MAAGILLAVVPAWGTDKPAPNVVIIYADDLGFGDVGCYNDTGKIPTPHIDRLAESGLRFTDAHAPDSICSPSRYGLITGRYSWRTSRKTGNPLPGEQPWISEERLTLPEMLKAQGYDTAAIGKWGLSADWNAAAKPGRKGLDLSAEAIDYQKPIYAGRPVGFTHEELHLWYGRSYHQTQYASNLQPGAAEKSDGGRWYFENGMSRGGDPDFAAFDMEEAQMHYLRRVVAYIDAKGGKGSADDFNIREGAPFFLYYAPHIPHWPHVPAPRFQGKTGLGLYGDFVYQLDWAVGQIVEALERNGLLEDTLLIFSSDNGPERQVYDYIEEHDHHSMGHLRGVKRDLWEGGHRVPFLVSWPGVVPAGKVTDRLVQQTDLFATLAHHLDVPLPEDAAEDSFSFLDEWDTSASPMPRREMAVHHSHNDQYALRQGDWIFIRSPSGETNVEGTEPAWLRQQRGIDSHSEPYELFDLSQDPEQRINLHRQFPEKSAELEAQLSQAISSGRTR